MDNTLDTRRHLSVSETRFLEWWRRHNDKKPRSLSSFQALRSAIRYKMPPSVSSGEITNGTILLDHYHELSTKLKNQTQNNDKATRKASHIRLKPVEREIGEKNILLDAAESAFSTLVNVSCRTKRDVSSVCSTINSQPSLHTLRKKDGKARYSDGKARSSDGKSWSSLCVDGTMGTHCRAAIGLVRHGTKYLKYLERVGRGLMLFRLGKCMAKKDASCIASSVVSLSAQFGSELAMMVSKVLHSAGRHGVGQVMMLVGRKINFANSAFDVGIALDGLSLYENIEGAIEGKNNSIPLLAADSISLVAGVTSSVPFFASVSCPICLPALALANVATGAIYLVVEILEYSERVNRLYEALKLTNREGLAILPHFFGDNELYDRLSHQVAIKDLNTDTIHFYLNRTVGYDTNILFFPSVYKNSNGTGTIEPNQEINLTPSAAGNYSHARWSDRIFKGLLCEPVAKSSDDLGVGSLHSESALCKNSFGWRNESIGVTMDLFHVVALALEHGIDRVWMYQNMSSKFYVRSGNKRLIGSDQDDTVHMYSGSTFLFFDGGDGYDMVQSFVDYVLENGTNNTIIVENCEAVFGVGGIEETVVVDCSIEKVDTGGGRSVDALDEISVNCIHDIHTVITLHEFMVVYLEYGRGVYDFKIDFASISDDKQSASNLTVFEHISVQCADNILSADYTLYIKCRNTTYTTSNSEPGLNQTCTTTIRNSSSKKKSTTVYIVTFKNCMSLATDNYCPTVKLWEDRLEHVMPNQKVNKIRHGGRGHGRGRRMRSG